MAETIRVQTDDKPTIFNKEMAVGAILASLIPVPIFPASVIAIGGASLVGGLIGRERMKNEYRVGKEVSSEPSFFRKDTIIGGFIGAAVGLVAAIFAGAALGGTAMALGATAATAMGIAGAALIATPLLGAVIGGYKASANAQEREREQFLLGKFHIHEQARQQERAQDIRPQFEQQVAKPFTQRVLEQRALQNDQKLR
ncbi:MAG: hypothetical protein AB7L92_00160 [Alphaproteobacteria bacterium]